jgi:hypothetical protein
MKRKVVMMGLAMVTGLPHAACAKGGEAAFQAYSSWNASYMPRYGAEGIERPLMDHVSVAGVNAAEGQGVANTWRLEFAPPPPVSAADAPVAVKDIRAGFNLKLDF